MTPADPAANAQLIATLSDGTKVKQRLLRMRSYTRRVRCAMVAGKEADPVKGKERSKSLKAFSPTQGLNPAEYSQRYETAAMLV